MNNFIGKRVLFFAPTFFGYEIEIANKLRTLGASVDYFDERPGNGLVTKAALRLYSNGLAKLTKAYYLKIFNKIQDRDYDYVLVVNQEAMQKDFVLLLKNRFKSAMFILYMWDSIKNKSSVSKIYEYFNKCYSFDRFDVEKYSAIRFRPLFFLDDYCLIKNEKKIYDLSFVGTVHGDRYWILKEIHKQLFNIGLHHYSYLYLNSPILYQYNVLFNKYFRKIASIKDFTFSPLAKKDLLRIIAQSKCVLDIQHFAQTGLTMRTFEVLAGGIKLVTTNADIMKYDFYDPNNICIIDRLNPKINPDFFETPFKPLSPNFFQKYSLEGWIKEVFHG